MKQLLVLTCLTFALPFVAAAQDVAITNVRIVVGTGSVIESGTIIVRGGRIASAGPGAANTQGLTVINGAGLTAVPGYIDGHKHVNNFNADQMRSLLEAGTTTVLAAGGPAEQNLALAEHINKGEWVGPRVIPSGTVNLRQTPSEARAGAATGGSRSPEGDRRRSEESRRSGERPRREFARDGGGRRCRCDAAGAPAEQGLHQLRAGRQSGADGLNCG